MAISSGTGGIDWLTPIPVTVTAPKGIANRIRCSYRKITVQASVKMDGNCVRAKIAWLQRETSLGTGYIQPSR